jgi:hypothetical protein
MPISMPYWLFFRFWMSGTASNKLPEHNSCQAFAEWVSLTGGMIEDVAMQIRAKTGQLPAFTSSVLLNQK